MEDQVEDGHLLWVATYVPFSHSASESLLRGRCSVILAVVAAAVCRGRSRAEAWPVASTPFLTIVPLLNSKPRGLMMAIWLEGWSTC